MGGSESESEDEFEDSRENLPPRDPVKPASSCNKIPHPTEK